MTEVAKAVDAKKVWANMKKMRGTSGAYNYALIAVRNGVGLGATMIAPQFTTIGGENYLMYAVHVRSAHIPEDELAALNLPNVHELGKFETLADYWPNFEFTKISEKRASGDLIVYFKGGAKITDGEADFPEALKDGSAAKKIVDKLLEIANHGVVVVEPRDLMTLYRQRDAELIASVKKNFEMEKEHAALVAASEGEVLSEAHILKKMKEAYAAKAATKQTSSNDGDEAFVPDDDFGDKEDGADD